MSAEGIRVCRKCSQEKQVSAFYKGNQSYCKECILSINKARDKAKREKREQRKALDNSLPLPYRFTGGKVCQKCKQRKPKTAFTPSYKTCKECSKAEAKERQNAKKEKERSDYEELLLNMPYHERVDFLERKRRDRHYKRNYGLSLARFDAMYKDQDGKCAICREERKPEDMVVDHDHTVGIVRGLLCHSCNTGIGHLKDSPEVLLRAAKYLNDFNGGLEGWIS